MSIPAQPFRMARLAIMSPQMATLLDPPPSTTRTRDSPAVPSVDLTIGLLSKHLIVSIWPWNLFTLPYD